jgi:hypothetical protein
MKRKFPTKRNRSDYEIGFGRPPKATQFKKGISGNKKGRPKGAKNIATLFHQEMYQRVLISENGQRRTITKIEAALKQLTNKAATGDPKAIHAIINIARELGDLRLPDPMQEPQVPRLTLRVFDKDIETGELVRVKPGTRQRLDDDE